MKKSNLDRLDAFTEQVSEHLMIHALDTVLALIRTKKGAKVSEQEKDEMVGFILTNVFQTCLVSSIAALRIMHNIPLQDKEISELSGDIIYCCKERLKHIPDLVTLPSIMERETENN